MFKPNSGRKNEHGVWNFFTYEASTDKSRCQIESCFTSLKGKNATNLVNHLRAKHKEIAADLESREKLRKKEQQTQLQLKLKPSSSTETVQTNIVDMFKPRQLNRKWSDEAPQAVLRNTLLTKIFASTGISTQFLDNPHVRLYHEISDEKFKLPRSAKMTSMLKAATTQMATRIKQDLKLVRHLFIAMDCWTKKGLTASFLAISASFFHPLRHQAIHVLLNLHQIAHPHTGDMLATKLMETLTSWEINKSQVMAVITDNGSNMIKAIRLAKDMKAYEEAETDAEETEDKTQENATMQATAREEEGDDFSEDGNQSDEELDDEEDSSQIEAMYDFTRFPCIAHTLQLVVKELCKHQAYVNLLATVKELVRFLKISSVASQKLSALCGKIVRRDCATRWNSVLLMIDRLLEIRSPLEEVLTQLKRDSLTNTEWARLAELQQLLIAFKEQTDALQTDTLCLSSVIPSLIELSLHLHNPSLPRLYANILHQSLTHRFSVFLDPSSLEFSPLPAAACFLDPTVLAVMLRDDMNVLLVAAKTYIVQKVTNMTEDSSHAMPQPATSAAATDSLSGAPPLKRFRLLAQDTLRRSTPASSDRPTSSCIDDELATYVRACQLFPQEDGLNFWIEQEAQYPLLAPLALDLLAAPASEAYVERVFSVCGDLTAGKRNRLTKELEDRAFFKMNIKHYDI